MARYRGPVCRLCRREGVKLFLKGSRCMTEKCAIERRNYPPGQHGQQRTKMSEYALQLREKQKVKRIYGVLERQFRRYFQRASRKRGMTGVNLLQILESRLDNVVYRMGIARSRKEARQLVLHGHFLVNGRRVNIPSYLVRPGDEIAVREKSLSLPRFQAAEQELPSREIPSWMEMDPQQMRVRIVALPDREEIALPVQEHLIVELYSK